MIDQSYKAEEINPIESSGVSETLQTNETAQVTQSLEVTTDLFDRPAPRRRPLILFLVPKTVKEKQPFMFLVKRYFNYLPPIELILNMMLLVGEFDTQKVTENILKELSNPLDFPLEDYDLREIPLLIEARRVCGKYQNEVTQNMLFRPDIHSVGNALLCTGNFSVDKIVNEIASLNKRPTDTRFFYRTRSGRRSSFDNNFTS